MEDNWSENYNIPSEIQPHQFELIVERKTDYQQTNNSDSGESSEEYEEDTLHCVPASVILLAFWVPLDFLLGFADMRFVKIFLVETSLTVWYLIWVTCLTVLIGEVPVSTVPGVEWSCSVLVSFVGSGTLSLCDSSLGPGWSEE